MIDPEAEAAGLVGAGRGALFLGDFDLAAKSGILLRLFARVAPSELVLIREIVHFIVSSCSRIIQKLYAA